MLRRAEPLLPGSIRAGGRSTRRWPSSPSGSTARTGSAPSIPAMANARDDVRLPRLRRGRSRAASPPRRRRQAAGRPTASETYCQPCLSPIWDTALACHALMEAGDAGGRAAVARAASTGCGSGRSSTSPATGRRRGRAAPGRLGLPVRQPALPRSSTTPRWWRWRSTGLRALGAADSRRAIDRAAEWVSACRRRNGGWGAFDADNTHYYLNYIPFADHGALLDPPTADVSGALPRRCWRSSATAPDNPAVRAGVDYLRREQEPDGSWFGRWGTNYIYGTWSALCALNAAGLPTGVARRSAAPSPGCWRCQNPDGGWGEDGASYWPRRTPPRRRRRAPRRRPPGRCSALMAAGEVEHPGGRARHRLLLARRSRTAWGRGRTPASASRASSTCAITAIARFFPLWALARYRNLQRGQFAACAAWLVIAGR